MLAFLSPLLALIRAAKNRRAVLALAELDDHMLRDIGLRRADIRAVLTLPLPHDPSQALKEICCRLRAVTDRFLCACEAKPAPCC